MTGPGQGTPQNKAPRIHLRGGPWLFSGAELGGSKENQFTFHMGEKKETDFLDYHVGTLSLQYSSLIS